MTVLAIDPGSEQSAWVLWDGERAIDHDKQTNAAVLQHCATLGVNPRFNYGVVDAVVIEQIASYGMAVGAEVFETVFWSGRFWQACYGDKKHRLYRREVKLHLCGQARAKDSNIRQALIDRFGGKPTAIGKKASPGPLYGITGDCWAALALAITFHDTRCNRPQEASL